MNCNIYKIEWTNKLINDITFKRTSKIRNVEFPDQIIINHVPDIPMKILRITGIPEDGFLLVQLYQAYYPLVSPVDGRGRVVTVGGGCRCCGVRGWGEWRS